MTSEKIKSLRCDYTCVTLRYVVDQVGDLLLRTYRRVTVNGARKLLIFREGHANFLRVIGLSSRELEL
jgi:hypothetical protein